MCLNKKVEFLFLSFACEATQISGVFSKLSVETSTCMCSTKLLSHKHMLAQTLKNMLTEIILCEMKSSGFGRIQNHLIIAEHGTCVVHGCACLSSGFSKQNHVLNYC
jgi:hypothetical protein